MSNVSPEWSDGYRTDLEYTFGLYPFLNPDTLLLACVMQGFRPPASILSGGANDNRGLVYCELGCGQGVTLNLLAARDPGGRYFGIDYNPNQVANARGFAKAGGINNVTFLEESFSDLDKVDMPDCDIVVLHGIWTWISDEMRAHIVNFLRRKLKPGGLCYVSYNCAVGRNDTPMRELLRVAERTSPKAGLERVTDAVNTAHALAQLGAKYFEQHPVAKKRVEGLLTQNSNYLTHEFLNESWDPTFFSEVADSFSEAKLNYLGSTEMQFNRPDLVLPKEAEPFKKRFTSTNDFELLKDLWLGTMFRKDLFVKGQKALTENELHRHIDPLRFVITKKRADCTLQFSVPIGQGNLTERVFVPVLDLLSKGPATGKEMRDIAEAQGTNIINVLQLLFVAGHIALCIADEAIPRIKASLANFDKAVLDGVSRGEDLYLASQPGTGLAISLSVLDYLIWRSTNEDVPDRATDAYANLRNIGKSISQNGEAIKDQELALKIMNDRIKHYDDGIAPIMTVGL